uniref:POP4 domain-containing protein n=1 Tax=Meloidogyne hapla TaxID=6305 RepID=A0A1I8B9B4_MELHA
MNVFSRDNSLIMQRISTKQQLSVERCIERRSSVEHSIEEGIKHVEKKADNDDITNKESGLIYEDGYNKATRTTDNNDNRQQQPTTTMTDNNNNRQPTKAMRMSTLLELQSTPCGTRLGKCCGRVTKIYKSPAKTTLILSCDDEEVCVVTGFHSTKGVADIVKFQLLKAQRFDEARFDGKRLYQTKLLYEFVIQSSTSISVSEADSVHVESIGDLTKAGIYGIRDLQFI